MARRNWMPNSQAEQLAMFMNINNKIGAYSGVLPLTAAQEARIGLICAIFIQAFEYVEQARATTSSLVEWRDNIFTGSPAGDAAQDAPTYASITLPTGAFIGIFTEFKEFRELIVASPGYTDAIGEDLMIVGAEITPTAPTSITPDLKVSVSPGYHVGVAGSMQGMDALRVEYQRNGATAWNIAAFLTKMPGDFTITPAAPGTPESGRIRGVFIQKNEETGNFSPEYPVTVS